MRSDVETRFSQFYDEWMAQLEAHLHLLAAAAAEYEAVVSKVTAHHKDYYKFKWAAAQEDVLAFFTPVWLSPLENAHLWMTGWKPSTAFRLVERLREGMSEEQGRRVEALRARMRAEEERVEREMERHQVAMADRKMVVLARMSGDAAAAVQVEGMVEGAVKGLLAGLEKVMKMADCVRLKTMKGVLDLLSPVQCVQFLAATSMLQIQMRKWGKARNCRNCTSRTVEVCSKAAAATKSSSHTN